MVIRELAAKLGLDIDFAAFAKAGGAIEVLRLGLDAAVNAAVGVVEQFAENVKSALEYGDELHDTSQAMGVATGALQELRYAGSLSNLAVGELDLSIKFLSRNMREAAQGTGDAGKAFTRLGVHVKDAGGKLRSADDVIGDLAEKIAALPDGTEKTALAMQFFGRSGQRLIPLLNEGRDGLAAMRKEARDLGLVMGKDSVDAADELGDNLRRLKAVGEGLWRGAIAPLLPAISDLVKQFLAWRKANAEIIRQNLQRFLGVLVDAVRLVGKTFAFVGETIALVKSQWQVALIAMTAVLAPFIVELVAAGVAAIGTAIGIAAAWTAAALPFIAIGAALTGVMLILDDIAGYKAGKDSLFGRFKDTIDEWLKPNENDPWWLAAIKELVSEMENFLGLAREAGLLKERQRSSAQEKAAIARAKKRGELDVYEDVEGRDAQGNLVTQSTEQLSKATARATNRYALSHDLGLSNQFPMYTAAPSGASSTSTATNHVQININGGDPAEVRRAVGQVLDERGVVDSSTLESSAAAVPASY